MSNNNEPVAWAVMLADGERIYDVYTIEEEAKAIDEAVTGNHGVAPLYRQPQTGSLAWISVKERMPEHCQIVMVTGPEIRHCEMAWVYEGREPWRNHYGEVYEANSVTHWMPLPAPPYTRWSG